MTRVHAIDIDGKASTTYIYFEKPRRGASVKQINIGDAVIFDVGADGRLIGIELLDPRLARQFAAGPSRRAFRASKIPVRRTA